MALRVGWKDEEFTEGLRGTHCGVWQSVLQ